MAVSAATVWEVRDSGSDDNGGGYVAGASGVDYSQQDSAQVTYTDLAIDSAGANKVASAANPFGSSHVGNVINITGGTGFTTGRYEITAVDGSNVATLDRNAGTTSSTGGTGKLGGALLSPAVAAGASSSNNTIWCSGTFTVSTTSQNVANGTLSVSTKILKGYGSSRGDAGKAIFDCTYSGGTQAVLLSNSFASQIRVQSSSASNHGFNLSGASLCLDCESEGFPNGYNGGNADRVCINCLAESCSVVGFQAAQVAHCVARSCAVGIRPYAEAIHCIAISCTTGGYQSAGGGSCGFTNCVAFDCADGFQRPGTGAVSRYVNCLAVSSSGYGFDSEADGNAQEQTHLLGCAGYDNASGNINGTMTTNVGFVTLTADPFVDAAGEDFRLNETSGGGLELLDAGYPQAFPDVATTPNHTTIGAAGPENFGSRAAGGRLYPTGRKKLLDGDIDLLADDIKVAFLLDTYSFDDADEFLDDLGAAVATNGMTANLSSKSTTGGVFDAADSTCTPDGSQGVNAIVLYKDTGSDATSPLICYIDNFTPFTTDGNAVPIIWSDGAEKIFAITDLV